MAANTLTRVGGFAYNTPATATEFTKLDTNGAGAIARASTHTGTRKIPLYPVDTIDSAGGGLGTRMCSVGYGSLTCVNVAYDLFVPLHELPHGHILNTVAMKIVPGGGHGAGAPAVLPSIHLYKVDTAGTATLLASSAAYLYVDAVTYEAGRTIATTNANHTIDRENYTYVIKIVMESGVNSQTGCVIRGGECSITVDNTYAGPDYTFWI